VPSAPPTQSTGTSLLTCQSNRFLDASSNGFAVTRNGDVKVTTFNPFGITNTGTTGSAYFDGTGDYLTAPGSNAFALTSVDWTIETWIYPTALNTYNFIYSREGGTNPTSEIELYFGSNGALNLNVLVSSTVYSANTSAGAIVPNAWQHVAAVRNGGTVTIYINGISAATNTTLSTLSLNDPGTSYVPNIINQAAAANRGMQGYASNFRFVKGTAVYTANFTPPIQPLTAIANTSLLTLQYKQPHNNHSFQDSSTNNHLITRSGNTTQGTFSPFSQTGWSNYFPATSDTTANKISGTITAFGTGNFTVAFWVNIQGVTYSGGFATSQNIVDGQDMFLIQVNSSNQLQVVDRTTSTIVIAASSSTAIPYNQWTNVALIRSGTGTNQTKLYVNGTEVGSATISTNFTGTTLSLGSRFTSSGGIWGPLYGYLSNFIYVDSALSPTTPTSPYTNVSGTRLLTCQSNRFVDNSSSPVTLTATSNVSVVAFSPFNPTASWSAATNGGSGYFDGTGDYLQLPITALSGQFTIEFWFYRAVTGNNYTFTIGDSLNATGIQIYIGTTGSILNYYTGQAPRITATPPDVGSWSYIAATRDSSNVVRLYVNGTQVGGTYTHAATLDTTLRVGAEYYSSAVSGSTNGYISNFRISNIVRTITLPTEPLVNDANTLCLLNFTNAGIYDATSKNVLETVGDAQISNTTAKWGSTSIKFDGTGDYLQSPDSELVEFGSGDFTIETWVRFAALPSSGAYYTLVSKWDNSTQKAYLFYVYNASGTYQLYFTYTTNGSTNINPVATITPSINTWYHYAVSRSGANLRMFIDGTQVGSTYNIATDTIFGGTYPLQVGASTGANTLNGYMQDVRVTKGYARYTANFTTPTAPFPTL